MLRHELEPAAQDFRTLPGRRGPPAGGCSLCGIDGAHGILNGSIRHVGQFLIRRRIHDRYSVALVPFAADVEAFGMQGGIGIAGDLGMERHGGNPFQFRLERSPW